MTEKEKMQKQTLYDMDYTPRTLNAVSYTHLTLPTKPIV